MAEWLTHVLIAYALFTAMGWVIDWINCRWVAVGMVGSILPDLSRIRLVVPDDLVASILGLPFNWDGLHTIAGIVALSAIGALLFKTPCQQRRGFVLLIDGAVSHLIVDLPQKYADGYMLTNYYLFPLPTWRLPTPNWYVSADRWVVFIALAIALVVFLIDYARKQNLFSGSTSLSDVT